MMLPLVVLLRKRINACFYRNAKSAFICNTLKERPTTLYMKLTNETIWVGKIPHQNNNKFLLSCYIAQNVHILTESKSKKDQKVLNTYIAALHTSNRHVII